MNLKSETSNSRSAFTLIELMVSMALVLILILGVNAVFRLTSDTINAGTALSTADRSNRGIQPVLYNDFQTAVVTGSPFFIIRSQRVAAFRNRADEQGDRDYRGSLGDVQQDATIRTVDLNGNNVEGEPGVPGEITSTAVYNARNHRVDSVRFFANHLFRRQTGSGRNLVEGGTASNEAYICYEHLAQPDFTTPSPATPGRFEHRGPGERRPGGNPAHPLTRNANNLYATDWILGREAILLSESAAPPGPLPPGTQQPQYIQRVSGTQSDPSLSPLATNSQSRDAHDIQESRYDLAQTSMAAYRAILLEALQQAPGRFLPQTDTMGTGVGSGAWYQTLSSGRDIFRFQGYRYPDRPLTAYGAARTVPVLMPACTQFIVEYAGDYLKQDAVGRITGTYLEGSVGTDGETDYIVVNPADPLPDQVRRVRWYGFPRNVDTSDDTNGVPSVKTRPARSIIDVVPLRDVLVASGLVTDPSLLAPNNFFEHFVNLPPQTDYAVGTGVPWDARYWAAWAPADLTRASLIRPRMIRITLVVDDPQGRLTEGQTYEYVIDLP